MLLFPSPLQTENKIYLISLSELLKYDFILGFTSKSSTLNDLKLVIILQSRLQKEKKKKVEVECTDQLL